MPTNLRKVPAKFRHNMIYEIIHPTYYKILSLHFLFFSVYNWGTVFQLLNLQNGTSLNNHKTKNGRE